MYIYIYIPSSYNNTRKRSRPPPTPPVTIAHQEPCNLHNLETEKSKYSKVYDFTKELREDRMCAKESLKRAPFNKPDAQSTIVTEN